MNISYLFESRKVLNEGNKIINSEFIKLFFEEFLGIFQKIKM